MSQTNFDMVIFGATGDLSMRKLLPSLYQAHAAGLLHPDYQRRGMAAALLNHYIATMRERGKRGVVLTCKAHLLDYYRGFGFVHGGVADSEHGGAEWHEMTLLF